MNPNPAFSSSSSDRLLGLDVVRVTAVLLVVFGHFLKHAHVAPWIHHFERLGIFGVEIFFVLSGYLIGGLLLRLVREGRFKTTADLRLFWSRRWLRTLPLYYLFFALALRYDWTGPQLFSQRLEFLQFLQNFAWRAPDFFLLSWSLTIEEWFYLLFPLALLFALRRGGDPKRAIGISVALFLIVPLVLRILSVPYPDWDEFNFGLRMITVKRLDALMYGVGLVYIRDYCPSVFLSLRRYNALSALLFGALSAYIYFDNFALWGHAISPVLQVIYFPLLSLSVALLLPYFSALQASPSIFTKSITYVSTISYSIYLGHIFVLTGLRTYLNQVPGRLRWIDDAIWPGLLLATLGTLALATVTYYLCERPFLMLRDRERKLKPAPLPLANLERA